MGALLPYVEARLAVADALEVLDAKQQAALDEQERDERGDDC
jgi:hypothetical protein